MSPTIMGSVGSEMPIPPRSSSSRLMESGVAKAMKMSNRSGATIMGGLLLGLDRKAAAEFSFLLGLPTLGAACLYKLMKNHEEIKSLGTTNCVLGVLVAAVCGSAIGGRG